MLLSNLCGINVDLMLGDKSVKVWKATWKFDGRGSEKVLSSSMKPLSTKIFFFVYIFYLTIVPSKPGRSSFFRNVSCLPFRYKTAEWQWQMKLDIYGRLDQGYFSINSCWYWFIFRYLISIPWSGIFSQ